LTIIEPARGKNLFFIFYSFSNGKSYSKLNTLIIYYLFPGLAPAGCWIILLVFQIKIKNGNKDANY
jgi:hypothetical protein